MVKEDTGASLTLDVAVRLGTAELASPSMCPPANTTNATEKHASSSPAHDLETKEDNSVRTPAGSVSWAPPMHKWILLWQRGFERQKHRKEKKYKLIILTNPSSRDECGRFLHNEALFPKRAQHLFPCLPYSGGEWGSGGTHKWTHDWKKELRMRAELNVVIFNNL